METDEARVTAAGRTIGALVDEAFGAIERIAPLVAALLARGPVPRAALAELDRVLLETVARQSGIVDGTGVAFAPGSLTDAPRWLEWWRSPAPGETEFRRHVFNSASLRDYDYTQLRWFTAPLREGRPVAVGPYLDTGGTDRNVVTIAVPVATPVGISVVASDLRLESLERAFRETLGQLSAAAVLVNANGRVIASKAAGFPAGALLAEVEGARVQPVDSREARRLPWRLVLLPGV